MTEDRVKKLLYDACCSILIDGNIVGTGWVASSCCIVSAGHLFTKIVQNNTVVARFANGCSYPLEIGLVEYIHDPLTDYAILKPLFGEIVSPALKCLPQIVTSGKFYTCGNGETLTLLSSAEGEILGYAQNSKNDRKPLLKVSSRQCGEPGYSGCPIYSAEVGAVIAIQSETTVCKSGSERDTILAYPLKYFWEELNSLLNVVSIELKEDPLGLASIVAETEFDRASLYLKSGDQMCAKGKPSIALQYYKIAKKIFESETGVASKYVANVQKKIKKIEKRD